MEHGYEHVRGGDHYIFSVPPNRAWTKQEGDAWAAIEKSIRDLHKAVQSFLDYVRANYVEIDLEALNKAAWEQYVHSTRILRKEYWGTIKTSHRHRFPYLVRSISRRIDTKATAIR
jgi:hypothetical protein